MAKTRPLDFRLGYDAPATDLTMTLEVTHDGSGVTYQMPGESAVALTSGSAATINLSAAESGDLAVAAASLDFSSTATEIVCTGQLGIRVDQIPASCTKFHTKADNATCTGQWLPSGLTDLEVESLRSEIDVDNIITALENGGASSGTLFLGEKAAHKTTSLLESRSWQVDIEPQVIHRIDNVSPYGSMVDGKALHHVDRQRTGTIRREVSGRCLVFDGTDDYVTTAHAGDWSYEFTELTITFWFKLNSGTNTGLFAAWLGSGDQRGFLCYVEPSSGKLDFAITTDGTQATGASSEAYHELLDEVPDGEWHHYAIQWNAVDGAITWYLDGELSDSTTSTLYASGQNSIFPNPATHLEFGRYNEDNARCIDGEMGPWKLWDQLLTPAQIAAEAALKPGKAPPNLPVPLLDYDWEFSDDHNPCLNKGSFGWSWNAYRSSTTIGSFDKYSYCNELGFNQTLARYSFSGATAWYAGVGSDRGFADEFRCDFWWDDSLTDGHHIGFSDTALTGSYGTTTYNHPRRCGWSLTASVSTVYVDGVSKGTWPSSHGDHFTVERDANDNAIFRRNGTVCHTEASVTGTHYFAATTSTTDQLVPVLVSENGTVLTEDDLRLIYFGDEWEDAGLKQDGTEAFVPADPKNPTQDILGLTLNNQGAAPRHALITSPAPDFDGSTEYGECSLATTIPAGTTFSFCGWFKELGGSSGADRFVEMGTKSSYNRGPIALRNVTGGWGIIVGTSSAAYDLWDFTTGQLTEWSHVAVTINSTTVKIYLNGIEWQDAGAFTAGGGGFTGTFAAVDTITLADHLSNTNKGNIAVAGMAIWSDTLTHDEVIGTMRGTYPSDNLEGLWPCQESSGTVIHDVSGNDRHILGCPTAKAETQSVYDYVIKNGFSKATQYAGSEYQANSSIPGRLDRVCIAFKVFITNMTGTTTVAAAWNAAGSRSWYINVSSAGALSFGVSDDGTNSTVANTGNVISQDEWTTVEITYDAGAVTLTVNGTVETETTIADTFAFDSSADFLLAGAQSGSYLIGYLSQFLFHKNPGTVWGEADKQAIRAAGSTAEIVEILEPYGGTPWYFPDGDSNETIQGLTSGWSTTGTPDERVVPHDGGLPRSYGPGVPAPSQVRRIATNTSTPFALQHAGDLELPAESKCYQAVFPGSSNWVDLGSTLIGATDDFDISFDMEVNAFPGSGTESIISQYTAATAGRFTLNAVSTGVLRFFVDNGASDVSMDSSALSAGKWYHVRITRVGDVFSLYVDGVTEATQTQAGVSVEQSNTTLGNDPSNGVGDFNGHIRNVRIDNNGTISRFLCEGDDLTGKTLTNVTVEESDGGRYADNVMKNAADQTFVMYEEDIENGNLAEVIGVRKYGQSYS